MTGHGAIEASANLVHALMPLVSEHEIDIGAISSHGCVVLLELNVGVDLNLRGEDSRDVVAMHHMVVFASAGYAFDLLKVVLKPRLAHLEDGGKVLGGRL